MTLELIKIRASVRRFSDKAVPKDTIDRILEAGRLAPSGGNEQSWKFGVITDRSLVEDIAAIAYGQEWMTTASFLMVLCTGIVAQERGGRDILNARFPALKEKIEGMDDELYAALYMEEHQTKIPGTQMMLTALEEGIFSTWISYFDVEALNRMLELPKGWTASEILAFGYPENGKDMKGKKRIEEIAFWNRYGGQNER